MGSPRVSAMIRVRVRVGSGSEMPIGGVAAARDGHDQWAAGHHTPESTIARHGHRAGDHITRKCRHGRSDPVVFRQALRPLYRGETIRKSKQNVIVEGEKTADAAAEPLGTTRASSFDTNWMTPSQCRPNVTSDDGREAALFRASCLQAPIARPGSSASLVRGLWYTR